MTQPQQPETEFIHDVALSYAGEDRPVVEEFATELRRRGVRVFYDRFYKSQLWGRKLYDYLSEVYSEQSRYCVVFVSKAYLSRDWTIFEFGNLKARSVRDHTEYLLPVRLDESSLKGAFSALAHVDMNDQSVIGLADLVCSKLDKEINDRPLLRSPQNMVIELRSDSRCDVERISGVRRVSKIQNIVLAAAGGHNCRLVGMGVAPIRFQLEANPTAYSALRVMYLSGDLNLKTGVKWSELAALEGKERAPAPFQVPLSTLAPFTKQSRGSQVVCHLKNIEGFASEAVRASKVLGDEVTSDPMRFRAYITCKGAAMYIHSNYRKEGCDWPTKLATSIPIDLFTLFMNLVFMKFPEETTVARAREIHTKQAHYIVDRRRIKQRGDEFYAGAVNIRFV